MNYQTKPTNRNDLRRFAKLFRKIFGVPETGAFPVLNALERLPDIFENCNFEVVPDKCLPPQTMAQCTKNDGGGFTIEIKETIYNGAYEKDIGAFLGFICHEICHVFLFEIGFPQSMQEMSAVKISRLIAALNGRQKRSVLKL